MHGDGLNIDLLLVARVDTLQKLASNNLKRQKTNLFRMIFSQWDVSRRYWGGFVVTMSVGGQTYNWARLNFKAPHLTSQIMSGSKI